MIAQSSKPKPAIDSIAPPGSGISTVGFFESGTRGETSYEPSDHDRDVHEKDRAPPEPGEQQAASDRTDGDAETDHASPEADGTSTLGRVAEDVIDDRERRGHHQRRAGTHHGATCDEQIDRSREGGPHRSTAEEREAE
jgi:hypothetical protein